MDRQQPPDENRPDENRPAQNRRLSSEDLDWIAQVVGGSLTDSGPPPGSVPPAEPPAYIDGAEDASAAGFPRSADPQNDDRLQRALVSGQVVHLRWGRRPAPQQQRTPLWRLRLKVWWYKNHMVAGPSPELLQEFRTRKFETLQKQLSVLLTQDGISQEERDEIRTALNTLSEGSDNEEALTAAHDVLIARTPRHGGASKTRKAIVLLTNRARGARFRRRREEAEGTARQNRGDPPREDEAPMPPLEMGEAEAPIPPPYSPARDVYGPEVLQGDIFNVQRHKVLSDNIFILERNLEKFRNATIPDITTIALHEEYLAVLTARLNGETPPPTTIEDNWEDVESAIAQMSGIGGNDAGTRPPLYPRNDLVEDAAGPSVRPVPPPDGEAAGVFRDLRDLSADEEAGMFFKSLSDLSADGDEYMLTVLQHAEFHLNRLAEERGGELPDDYEDEFRIGVEGRARSNVHAALGEDGRFREISDNRYPKENSPLEDEVNILFDNLSNISENDNDYILQMLRQARIHLQGLGDMPVGFAEAFRAAVAARASDKIAASSVNKGKGRLDDQHRPGEGSGS